MASYLHRTAQPSTLATFRSWGSSTGAGRIRLADANIRQANEKARQIIRILIFSSTFIILRLSALLKPGIANSPVDNGTIVLGFSGPNIEAR